MNDILFTPIRLNELEILIENSVKKVLQQSCANGSGLIADSSEQLFTIKQASSFLSLSVPTIYGLVQRSEIPVSKRGKRLYFSKQELTDWIKAGRKLTVSEIESKANKMLAPKKR